MDCRKAAQYLYEYVDRELDNQTTAEMEVHLKHCRHCFDAFDIELKLKELVRERAAASPLADQMKGRILAELARLADQPQAQTPKARRFFLWGGVGVAAAAVVLLFAFGLPDLNRTSDPRILQLVTEHQNHLATANHTLLQGVPIDSVNGALAVQLGFNPELNLLKNISPNLMAFHAVALDGQPAACLFLAGSNGTAFSLMICRQNGPLPKGERYSHNGKEYVLAEHAGVRMAFWEWDGMLCCSVGKCSEKELLDFTWSV